jgi:arylsulfatase A-like enzyme
VLVILIDDCGFGASSAFGGPVNTPSAERLAGNGLKFNRFDTTALCSSTRQALTAGTHQARMEFTYDGGSLAKGGSVSLYVDGKKDGEGRVEMTVPMLFGTDTCDVGRDAGSPVSPDYGPE